MESMAYLSYLSTSPNRDIQWSICLTDVYLVCFFSFLLQRGMVM